MDKSGRGFFFLSEITRSLEIVEEQYTIPVAVLYAIIWLESDKFQSDLTYMANNITGKKAGKNWDGPVYCKPHDEVGKNSCFRAYSSHNASIQDIAQHLYTAAYYADCFTCEMDNFPCWLKAMEPVYDEGGEVIEPGYATDPEWKEKILKIINDYEFDVIKN